MNAIQDNEVKALRDLMPYFSVNSVVFDVGSNKGFWADLVVKNVSQLHLFEPNEMLLTYTKVKYDDRTNVYYNAKGCFSQTGRAKFFYFTNWNNGLSSIFYNERWVNEGLPMKFGECDVIALDDYWNKEIDFIKIDVEGAEIYVLEGAKRLLSEHKIKFIQFEYGEHYKLNNIKLDQIIDFVGQFGYKVFKYNGGFNRITSYVDDYELTNFYIFRDFTQDWNKEFKCNTSTLPKMEFALEIGCFEGLTTRYICDNLLTETGRIICVDPLEDKYTDDSDKATNDMFIGQYERFKRNIEGYPVELIRKRSRAAYDQLKDYRFNFIYIDGDHSEEEVFNDGVKCWELLRERGSYLLFDDYLWSEGTQKGIDRFLESQAGNYQFMVKGYQVLIKRLR